MEAGDVGVVGAGTMGSGIAQVFLQSGFSVILVDRSEEQLEGARSRIGEGLEKVEEELPGGPDRVMENLEISTSIEDTSGCDLVVEAVPEELEVKRKVFGQIMENNAEGIMASNTSSIPIKEISETFEEKGRFVGMHFFNPPPLMDIIEIVRTEFTSDDVMETVKEIAKSLGKEYGVVRDVPGFVSNRILMPFLNEAMRSFEDEIAVKEDIDAISREGFNHPMGPLELADFIGLDVCLEIMEGMHDRTGEERFRPASILRESVEEGKVGKKSGEGFYTYD